ncbi:Baseplate protein J-like domain-containing protein [Paraburkholderia sacchari]|uniref:putative baseplate assembly protein n=1 Tax=Paraburkholderia sacchari TaxID=159450 RepID=UPI0039A562A2
MTTTCQTACKDERRRRDVRKAPLFGLDFAEPSDDQRTLVVWFLGRAPQGIEMANLTLTGGRRIRDVAIVGLQVHRQTDPALDDFMEVAVDKPGDFSVYVLSVVAVDDHGKPTSSPMAGFDPRYASVDVKFKAACPTGLDCKLPHTCPPSMRAQPEINYLAKDYASFRQLILDRLALIMPQWQETHVPDLGITLIELLAYVGDYLSYYQDAVATEAYLGTARQRISVRRHVRLTDYAMHEGCNARAWIAITTDTYEPIDAGGIEFITSFPGVPNRTLLTPSDLEPVPPADYDVFRPLLPGSGTIELFVDHSEIRFYAWGDCECCLAPGTTSATLIDRWLPSPATDSAEAAATAATLAGDPPGTMRALRLKPGDVLILAEVIGPRTGNPADADPTHRQAVRLTKVTPAIDPLYHQGDYPGTPVVEIEWDPDDALAFPLCISVKAPPPDCNCLENVSVAFGNVVLVDNGATQHEVLGTVGTASTAPRCAGDCEPAGMTIVAERFAPALSKRPLSFGVPLPACASAAALIAQDPRQALPLISLTAIPAAPDCPELADPAPPCSIPPLFTFDDLADPTGLAYRLITATDVNTRELLSRLSAATRLALAGYTGGSPMPPALKADLIVDLSALLETWQPRYDLLESGPDDRVFVVEMDDDGYGHLRFGDGRLGRQPAAGTLFRADYRTGNGPAGNVGAGTIRYLVLENETLSGIAATAGNPMAATGGTAPEPVADVKRFAPYAFRDVIERAVIADDYAALAADNARRHAERPAYAGPFVPLQGAKAVLRWTGSWLTALTALDPLGREDAPRSLTDEVAAYLEPYRRIGHDLLVSPAEYIAIDLALTVCVLPGYLRAHVEAALLDVFSNRVLADGSLGFFHPDRLTFGTGPMVSNIVAAAQAVPGVQNVKVSRLERWERVEPVPGESLSDEVPPGSVLALGPLEIARLDNDPNFPENGRLTLDMRGGR